MNDKEKEEYFKEHEDVRKHLEQQELEHKKYWENLFKIVPKEEICALNNQVRDLLR